MSEESFMRLQFRTIGALVLISFSTSAQAQDGTHAGERQTHRPTLTGKERLGPKWTDEQRIDNCHVPIDKRGSKPRPTACPDGPSS
jgi:hypothetical protein